MSRSGEDHLSAVIGGGCGPNLCLMFLPGAATLLPAVGEEPAILTWDLSGDLVYDVLWVESWDTPLPLSNTLSELGGCVRLLDLTRPFASRLYGQDVSRTTLTALPWFDTTAAVGTSGRARRIGRQGAKTLLEAGSQVSAGEATAGADQLEAPQAAGPEPAPTPAAGTEPTGQESTAASPSVGRVRKRSHRARGVA